MISKNSILVKFLLISTISLFYFFWLSSTDITTTERKGIKHQSKLLSNISLQEEKKSKNFTILFWTKYFNRYPLRNISQCALLENCRVVTDRNYLNQSNAVIFHGGVIGDMSLDDLPESHPANQMWVFFQLEAPIRTLINLTQYKNIFNWTMTYRLDSDVYRPYFKVFNDTSISRKPFNASQLQDKTKLVAWFVSNCYTPSKREEYVKDLRKYVVVDIYGKCGNLSCPREINAECFQHIGKQYKFYLAFENSICEDYVTEKLLNPLQNNLVPVVMGGADYNKIAPPNSFINVDDFTSPKELAEYLMFLDRTPEKYLEYFQWQTRYEVKRTKDLCSLCEKLMEQEMHPGEKIYADLSSWWNNLGNNLSKLEMKNIVSSPFEKGSACYHPKLQKST